MWSFVFICYCLHNFFFICVTVKVYRPNLLCRFLNIALLKVLNHNYCIGKLLIKHIRLIDVCNTHLIWCMLLLTYVWWFIESFLEEWHYIELSAEDRRFSKTYPNTRASWVIDGFYMWTILIKTVPICIYQLSLCKMTNIL